MAAFTEHIAHHPRHMIACVVGALVMVIGFALDLPVVAAVGAVACAAGCGSMIWMMVIAPRTHRYGSGT
jgi:hypothetical protein